MSKHALQVKNVHKSFRLPTEQANGIKQAFVNWTKGIKGYKEFTVLDGVSFTVEKGDFFGIVGRNGSGKSTLLKIISGIYLPNKGGVKTEGRLVPFIELGVGFNPELTGRENVYLNGALLGFNRQEVTQMYDDIVEFAEIEEFMDQKLKNYSSGMQVRLAFSIAIRAEADILVLDEVLAVGDEAFQKKCYAYFDELKRKKRTVILVTHDMAAVERFCNKALFIDKGKINLIGQPHKVAAAYSRSNRVTIDNIHPEKDEFSVELLGADSQQKTDFEFGETMTVRLSWNQKNVLNAGVAIFRDNGEYVFGPNTYQDKYKISKEKVVCYEVKLNLNEGEYFIKAGLTGKRDIDTIAFIEEGPHFTVQRDYNAGRWGGVTKLEYKWK